jgi:hypothetical protein
MLLNYGKVDNFLYQFYKVKEPIIKINDILIIEPLKELSYVKNANIYSINNLTITSL